MREFLPVGGVLMTGDKNCSFAIMDTIAYGGTSLIYRVEIPGTCRTFILKEFFPVSSEVYRYKRQDYNVVSDFSDKKKSHMCEMHLEQLWKQENEIGQRLGRKTIREAGSLITLDITCLLYENIEYPLKNQHFLLLDDLTGKGAFLSDFIEEAQKPAQEGYPVRRGGLPSIHLTSKIMSEITRAIIDIHKEGMIYGDVQPGNVYFLGGDVREGYVGIGIFLDYGTCRFLEKDGKTPIYDEFNPLYSTAGYKTPEMHSTFMGIRLSPKTDICALGMLFFYMLRSFSQVAFVNSLWDIGKWPVFENQISEDVVKKLGGGHELVSNIKEILRQATEEEPEKRFHVAEMMRKSFDRLVALSAPPLHNLSQNLKIGADYITDGRKRETQEIINKLETGINPLVVYGIGGIGKSKLISAVALEYYKDEAFFCTYKGSLKKTIAKLVFSDVDDEGVDEDEQYRRNLSYLRAEYRGKILIIDNYDSGAKNWEELKRMDGYQAQDDQESPWDDLMGIMKVIFTTRCYPGTGHVCVKSMDDAWLLQLFWQAWNGEHIKETEEDILELIRDLDGHTLSVKLFSATMRKAGFSVKEMREIIQDHDLARKDIPMVYSDMDGSRAQRILYHLMKLWDVSSLSPIAKTVLCHTLFIPDSGAEVSIFRCCQNNKENTSLEKLIDLNWVQECEGIISVHPLIREVISYKIKNKGKRSENFVRCILKEGAFELYNKEIATEVLNSPQYNKDVLSYADLCMWIAENEERDGRLGNASQYCMDAITKIEHVPDWNSDRNYKRKLGSIYYRAGFLSVKENRYEYAERFFVESYWAYTSLNEISAALNCRKELMLMFKIQGKTTQELEQMHALIGSDQFVMIRNENPQKYFIIATGLINALLDDASGHKKTLALIQEANLIAEQYQSEIKEKDLAQFYYVQARSFYLQAFYDEALIAVEKSLEHVKKAYGEKAVEICSALNLEADILEKKELLDKALQCCERSYTIRKIYYGEENTYTGSAALNYGLKLIKKCKNANGDIEEQELEKNLQFAEKLITCTKESKYFSSGNKVRVYLAFGQLYELRGDLAGNGSELSYYEDADFYYKRALKQESFEYEQEGISGNFSFSGIATILFYRGGLLLKRSGVRTLVKLAWIHLSMAKRVQIRKNKRSPEHPYVINIDILLQKCAEKDKDLLVDVLCDEDYDNYIYKLFEKGEITNEDDLYNWFMRV